jgi:hypothetical protein
VPAMRIVNTSPLVFLVRAGLVEMLRAGDHDVVVPERVIVELRGHGENDPTVKAIRAIDWLTVLPGFAQGDMLHFAGLRPVITETLGHRAQCEFASWKARRVCTSSGDSLATSDDIGDPLLRLTRQRWPPFRSQPASREGGTSV